ncbi:nucleobase:cation symporter-2 family protein [Caulobacter hibisci]|uniref:Purine permease n=1 Tax=Caulobacter hibisci TaxID=2035993 RepID=A0ABS0SZU3_9CAUL|nr:nucleobase:cation symporter-2 family protein [Caulobacter hibisci]MBI1685145.1 purine permease [Caulobacter hibisci]
MAKLVASAVDARPPAGRLLLLAIQHVLSMYAGAITVPLVVAGALGLTPAETGFLVSASLLTSGVVTIVQCLGLGPFGIKLPVVMGVTFVGALPAVAIASASPHGLAEVFGAAIVAGVVGLLVIPFMSRLTHVLTPVVTGTAMLLIGVSLIGVTADWAAGGRGAARFGDPVNLLIAAVTLTAILTISRFGRGFLAATAILAGMIVGVVFAGAVGALAPVSLADSAWIAPPLPGQMGWPHFDLAASTTMVVVMLITLVESSGMLIMLGRISGRPLDAEALARGLRTDALGSIIGGLLGSFPCTSYSQNIALVGLTGVASRWVCATAGALLVVLAMVPKLSLLVAGLPSPVLGGAGLVLFGMVAAAGVHALSEVDYAQPGRLTVVAVSLALGLLPMFRPTLFDRLPKALAPFLENGMLIGVVSAIALNLLFKSTSSPRPAAEGGSAAPLHP